ncbi:unnamed protein product [Protopolystoma xenopodis]|uniref:Uncharacterized protein n=1 Tax=Protopolystoma xenopodis TaxID=117903 RepID=A0A3S5AMF0_9PLAT|nr:unnamed protein product [Protopolystoma xenopodis]
MLLFLFPTPSHSPPSHHIYLLSIMSAFVPSPHRVPPCVQASLQIKCSLCSLEKIMSRRPDDCPPGCRRPDSVYITHLSYSQLGIMT